MEFLFDLTGKTALVTGASSGIGSHFAGTLANAGANVALAARRTSHLKQRASEISRGNREVSWVHMDVTDSRSVEAAFSESVDIHNRIDIVVNNAGIAHEGKAMNISEQSWDAVMNTNLKGAWLVAQQAGLHMSTNEQGGSIVNIVSILARRVMGGLAPYATAKAALEHLTRVLAYEWARYSVRVNAIAPGYIATEMNKEYLESPMGDKARKNIPLRRFGLPSDLDGALLLLASDASSYMTGSTIVADGGHLQSSL